MLLNGEVLLSRLSSAGCIINTAEGKFCSRHGGLWSTVRRRMKWSLRRAALAAKCQLAREDLYAANHGIGLLGV
ncbi:hypothetical protein BRADI_4g20203v3 [Brachypodium distachyon]|uniref:Uncharacterized protein n=1 Tax=Brachypodium distachyon TaxID=15368 RepID=A0A2K2CNW3_BRADI|nr:hypothetical protein BRADI_4g20203v3 [Brachypodium distachyon]